MPLHQEGSVRRHFNEMIEKEAKKHAAEFEPASSQLQGVFSTAVLQQLPYSWKHDNRPFSWFFRFLIKKQRNIETFNAHLAIKAEKTSSGHLTRAFVLSEELKYDD